MKKLIATIGIVSLAACGSGGSDEPQGFKAYCPEPGYSNACTQANICCPDATHYLCQDPRNKQVYCAEKGCGLGQIDLDYCDE